MSYVGVKGPVSLHGPFQQKFQVWSKVSVGLPKPATPLWGLQEPSCPPPPPARIWGITSLAVLLDFCLFSFDLKVWPQTRESEVLSFGPYQVFIRNVGSECFSLSGDSDFFQSVCFLHPLEARCVPGSSSAQPLTLTAIIIMLLLLSLAASKMI